MSISSRNVAPLKPVQEQSVGAGYARATENVNGRSWIDLAGATGWLRGGPPRVGHCADIEDSAAYKNAPSRAVAPTKGASPQSAAPLANRCEVLLVGRPGGALSPKPLDEGLGVKASSVAISMLPTDVPTRFPPWSAIASSFPQSILGLHRETGISVAARWEPFGEWLQGSPQNGAAYARPSAAGSGLAVRSITANDARGSSATRTGHGLSDMSNSGIRSLTGVAVVRRGGHRTDKRDSRGEPPKRRGYQRIRTTTAIGLDRGRRQPRRPGGQSCLHPYWPQVCG